MAKCRYCGKEVHLGKWQHERYCPKNPDHMTAVGKAKEHRPSRFKLEGAGGIKSMWHFWNHCFLGRTRAYQPRKLELKERLRLIETTCLRCGKLTSSLEYTEREYSFLFCWHKVPGEDNEKILNFVSGKYRIDMSGASIEEEGGTVKITTKTHEILLELDKFWFTSTATGNKNNLRRGISLKIDNSVKEIFYIKYVGGKINVYYEFHEVCRNCMNEIETSMLEGARKERRRQSLESADKFHDLLDECEKKGTCDILAAHHELLQNDDDRLTTSVLQDLICINNYEDKWNEMLDESKANIESKRLEFKNRIVAGKGNEVSGDSVVSIKGEDANQ